MNIPRAYWIFKVAILLSVVISGCIPQEQFSSDEVAESTNSSKGEVPAVSNTTVQELGTLCLEKETCISFCQNNQRRCEEHCKGNTKNELCRILFPPGEEKKQTEKQQERKPTLKNLGLTIEPWNKQTKRAGDFLFENKNYVDNKIFTEFAHKIVNDRGEKLLPEIGFNVPVGTNVVSPIDGIITEVKWYEPSQDYLISLKTDESSPWIVGFEHVYKVRVNVGDTVVVGQELAQVSPSYGKTEFGNVEINVWTGGQSIIKYCPFEFFDASVKPLYEEKINRLAEDWEAFIGKEVYQQEEWVAPGCLRNNITER